MIKNNLILGIVLGIEFCIAVASLPFSDSYKYRQAITKCEADIPKKQHCTVIAVFKELKK